MSYWSAGDGTTSFVADSALATATPAPVKGLTVAADGTLIYASGNLVRRIDGGGRVSTLAGYNLPNGPGPTPARAVFFNTDVRAVAAEPTAACSSRFRDECIGLLR